MPDDINEHYMAAASAIGGEIAFPELPPPDPGASFKSNQIIVTQENLAATLGGTIDSAKEYFLDGILDPSAVEIVVPVTGMQLRGYSFDTSGFSTDAANYTLFKSAVSVGSGDLLLNDMDINISGTDAQVYDLCDSDGTHAVESRGVNWTNCTSMGTLEGYRQGFELDTGRFGGSPTLTLDGAWAGGFRIIGSIVRGLDAGMTDPVFKAGATFVMQNRFLTDINCDLPLLAALSDFDEPNFPNPSTLQAKGIFLSRNGLVKSSDTNLTVNIEASSLSCEWRNNVGLDNTFIGGNLELTTEALTTITLAATFVDLAGTWTATLLVHYDSPANNKMRHKGTDPREFLVTYDFTLVSTANDQLILQFIVDRAVGGIDIVSVQQRQVNNLSGPRDVAFFSRTFPVILDKDDTIRVQVANALAMNNITGEESSYFLISER